MPELITVTEFISETNEDYKAPTTSSFTTRMSHCRNAVAALEEVRKQPDMFKAAVKSGEMWYLTARSGRKHETLVIYLHFLSVL